MSDHSQAPGQQVRTLVRAAERAGLATLLAQDESRPPYVSLVLAASDYAGNPLLLLSDLADHTKNLAADSRLALLFDGTAGLRDPLTGARASVLGRAEMCGDPRLEARFVARHPGAAVYAGFADFHLYRVVVERAHLVSGFGQIHWIDAHDLLFDAGDDTALAAAEAEIVAHMNAEHEDAVQLNAERLLDQPGEGWQLVGVDPEGADLRRDGRLARIAFDKPVRDAEGARVELVRLTKRARQRAAAPPPQETE
jgi:putative heme iron utilization protein